MWREANNTFDVLISIVTPTSSFSYGLEGTDC